MRLLAIAALAAGCATGARGPGRARAGDDLPPPGARIAAEGTASGLVAGSAGDGVGEVWRSPAVIERKREMLRAAIELSDGRDRLELRIQLFELLVDPSAGDRGAEALALGAALLAEPGFAAVATADQVLAEYAEALRRGQRAGDVPAIWRRLIRDYPRSRWAGTASVALGDDAFAANDLTTAGAMYERALGDPLVGAYARYKRAWVAWNRGDLEAALADFVEVARVGREPLRREALKDVVRAFAEVGSPAQAEAFFRALDRAGTPTMLLRLAAHYADVGKDRDAAATYALAQPQLDDAGACRAQVGLAAAVWRSGDRAQATAALAALQWRRVDPACADEAAALAKTVAQVLTREVRALRSDPTDAIAAWIVVRTLAPAGPRRRDAATAAATLAHEHATAAATALAWAAAADASYEAAVAGDAAAGDAALDAWRQAVALDPALAGRAAAGRALLERQRARPRAGATGETR
ncbi:MAG: hypothetical protein IPL61_29060 [Myxococcales bacterium]|nr:hypothetical protein [Myxococcales bacterium]